MSEQKKKKSWRDGITPDALAAMGARNQALQAEGAWTYARAARRSAVSALRRIAALPLSHDQAKRSANQVAKLREELVEVEATLVKLAEELEG